MNETQVANQLSNKAESAGATNKSAAATQKAADVTGAGVPKPATTQFSLRSFRVEAEIHAISQALEQTGWNRRRAAELLSISYRGLLEKIRQHNINSETRSRLAPWVHGAKTE